jgi:multidrug efflux pump subunit AcrB
MIVIKFDIANRYRAFQRLLILMLCVLLSLSVYTNPKVPHSLIEKYRTKTCLFFLNNPGMLSVSSSNTAEQLIDRNYLKDRQPEIKQLCNTYKFPIYLKANWIRSAGGFISTTQHSLRLKKHSAILPKYRPKIQSICRSLMPSINTCQKIVPPQHFIPPRRLTI